MSNQLQGDELQNEIGNWAGLGDTTLEAVFLSFIYTYLFTFNTYVIQVTESFPPESSAVHHESEEIETPVLPQSVSMSNKLQGDESLLQENKTGNWASLVIPLWIPGFSLSSVECFSLVSLQISFVFYSRIFTRKK